MTLRTGKLDVLAAELVGPGEEGWEDVIEVFSRARDEEQERGKRYAPSVDAVLGDALAPVNLGAWLVYEQGHGLSVWGATEVANRLPKTHVSAWDVIRDAWVRLEVPEDALSAVCEDESVSTGSAAPTHWDLYANGEYVGSAPVKEPKPPKRCMWVWGIGPEMHQCEQPRGEPHGHYNWVQAKVQPWRWNGKKRCLGAWVYAGSEIAQCEAPRDECKHLHDFYAKTRMSEEDKPLVGAQRCPWVWNDTAGWHQCGRRRGDHGHDEAPGFYVELETEGEPRCLGLWALERQPGEVEVLQCPLLAADCESYHPFYARRGFEEQT